MMVAGRLVFILIAFAAAQQGVVQVIRVDEVMPLLNSLMNSGDANWERAAERFVEAIPASNLQGSLRQGANMISEAVQAPFSSGGSSGAFLQPFSGEGELPIFANIMSYIDRYEKLKEQPVPTLSPVPAPEVAGRAAADLGIVTAAAKNTLARVTALPAQTIASGGTAISDTFGNQAKQILGTPAQINELLQFQHSLFENYLAGFQQGTSVVTSESATEASDGGATKLREDIMRLTVIEPRLRDLLTMLDNPRASGVFQTLGEAFNSISPTGVFSEEASSSNSNQSLLIDPTTMRVAFGNIALNFLRSLPSIERGTVTL